LGFYPASPGHAEYALGSPLFRKATIHLESGKQFVISAPNNSSDNVFIQEAKLNGTPYSRTYLLHSDIVAGGELELSMGPSKSLWGTGDDDLPHSATPSTSLRIPTLRLDRAVDGVIRASSENAEAGMLMAQAFDDDSGTQWQALTPTATIQYAFPYNRKYPVSLYTVTSAADSPESDPQNWELQGSEDCSSANAEWTTIDQRRNEAFIWRRYTRVFSASNHQPFACYRMNISQNHGGRVTQVAELELLGDAPLDAANARAEQGCDATTSTIYATDGSLYSFWCSESPDARLSVDLGIAYTVTQVTLYHAGADGGSEALNTRAYSIDISPDGTNWSRAVDVDDNHDSLSQHSLTPTLTRQIRLTVRQPNSGVDNRSRIREIEVYGYLAP